MDKFELKCKLRELFGSRAYITKTNKGAYAMVSHALAAEAFQIMTDNFRYFEVERMRNNTTFTVLLINDEIAVRS